MNGVPILDNTTAITDTLTFSATEGHNGAVFRCVVTDEEDGVTIYSDPATLIVLMAPVILTNPEDQTVVVGQRATFQVIATGNPAVVYQWERRLPTGGGWNAIPGATRSSYRTVPTTMADDQTEFRCIVSNSEGNETSSIATLTVEPRLPTFVIHPEDRVLQVGEVAVFRVWALGTDLEYQWQMRPSGYAWTDIPGATETAYSTGPVNVADHHAAQYRCRVNNQGYTTFVFSNAATITIIGAPTITKHPTDQTVNEGETATFSIEVTGSTYQWEKRPWGGTWAAIPGATSTSYTTPPATMADHKARFRCLVTNDVGTVTSGIATLTVLGAGAPVITSHPANRTVYEGQTASFTVVATGTSPLSYQWQERPPAGTWGDIPGEMSDSYTTPLVSLADNGTRFRCIVTNNEGTATTGPATLTVLAPTLPAVITEPINQTACVGGTATFSVVATDSGPLNYQWQRRNGAPWVDIPGATSDTYTTPPLIPTDDGARFRCRVGNAAGSVDSDPAILTVWTPGAPPHINDPTDQMVCEGETATFSVTVLDPCPPDSFLWQVSIDDGASWNNATAGTGETTDTYTTEPVDITTHDGYLYRCRAHNTEGNTFSASARLTVDQTLPTITTQPTPQTVCDGQTATFSIAATSPCPINGYQWQVSTDDGASWAAVTTGSGATSNTYTTEPVDIATHDGYLYRCRVRNDAGGTNSAPARLTVDQTLPTITTQPTPQTVCVGQTATFSVAATSPCPLSYRWQFSTDGGASWTNVTNGTGLTTDTYTTISALAGHDGRMFRCRVRNDAGATLSDPAMLTVDQTSPTITTQPANQTVCIGQTATFSVVATSPCPLSYRWQFSTDDGSTWTNVTGGVGQTAATFTTIPTVALDDGTQFRCRVTNAAGNTFSLGAVLTVDNQPPIITTQPANQTVCIGQTATFSVVATSPCPLTYRWQFSTDNGGTWNNVTGGVGQTADTFTTVPTVAADDGVQFRCRVSNAAGPTISLAAVVTVDSTPPAITTQPANQTVCEGETATFSVVAAGPCPITSYQWQFSTNNGGTWSNVTGGVGQTAATFTTVPTVAAEDGTHFRCRVRNDAGDTFSLAGVLTVDSTPPVIATQPANQAVCVGQTAIFSVVATGPCPPLSYKWQFSTNNGGTWNDVTGGVGFDTATFTTIPNTAPDDGTQFRCQLTNAAGTTNSLAAVLTVDDVPPAITTQPAPQTVCEGDTATFSVVATTGCPPVSYQWQFSTDDGATWNNVTGGLGFDAASFTTVPNTAADDGTQFRCQLTNAAGTTNSLAAVLTVGNGPPTITTNPANQTVCEGQTATFSVAATTGCPPISYQWQFSADNGGTWNNVTGGVGFDTASFTTVPSSAADNGTQFRCQVTNTAGTTNSLAAVLTVDDAPPAITTNPANQTVCEGDTATFSVVAITGCPPISYQWQFSTDDGGTWNPVTGGVGQTADTFTTVPTIAAEDGTQFRCRVSNAAGIADSLAAILTVGNGPPTITTNPANQTVTEGDTATFSVVASSPCLPLSYQWREYDGSSWSNIPGATSDTYTTPPTDLEDDGLLFLCRVRNDAGFNDSSAASLTVESTVLPVITQQPQDQAVYEGDTATFTVVATGPGPLSYQWERDGSYITGATSSSYITDPVLAADDGARFRCDVSSAGNTVTSNEARLTVLTEPTAAFPFAEDFETGVLEEYWSTNSTGNGRILVTSFNDPAAGSYHLTMDSANWMSPALNEVLLNVNLAGETGVMLSFLHKEFNDDNHVMPSTFVGSHNSDGVAISQDGNTWYKVQGLTSVDGTTSEWQAFEVDLDAAAAAAGIGYNTAFKIKFQQYGKNPIVSGSFRFSDGFAFDDIELY
jgi:hypothetical protein